MNEAGGVLTKIIEEKSAPGGISYCGARFLRISNLDRSELVKADDDTRRRGTELPEGREQVHSIGRFGVM